MKNNNPPNGKTEIYLADRVCLHDDDDDDNDYLTAKYYYLVFCPNQEKNPPFLMEKSN